MLGYIVGERVRVEPVAEREGEQMEWSWLVLGRGLRKGEISPREG